MALGFCGSGAVFRLRTVPLQPVGGVGHKPGVGDVLADEPFGSGVEHADPTLIKTGKYARAWGYGGQLVGNVHAYRVTDSRRLVEADGRPGRP